MSAPAKTSPGDPVLRPADGRRSDAGRGAGGTDGTASSETAARQAPARETIRHPGAEALDLAQILRTVGDPLRLAMVRSLAGHEELLCGALADGLGLPKSTSSYHLRLLREAGVTRTRQAGTLRYVSLRRDDLEARFPGLVDVLVTGEAG